MEVVLAATITGGCSLLLGIFGTHQYHLRRNGNGYGNVNVNGHYEQAVSRRLIETHDTDLELLKRVVGQHDVALAVLQTQFKDLTKLFEQRFNQIDDSLAIVKKRLSG